MELKAAAKHAGDIALLYRTLLAGLGDGFNGNPNTLLVVAYIVRPDDLPTWMTLAVGSFTWLATTAQLDLALRLPR